MINITSIGPERETAGSEPNESTEIAQEKHGGSA
jgi:hypothetical protein